MLSHRARSGSGCWFESSFGHGVHLALSTLLLFLCNLNETRKLVKRVQKSIRKAVVRMWKLRNMLSFRASVLTGGFLAWTGRDGAACR